MNKQKPGKQKGTKEQICFLSTEAAWGSHGIRKKKLGDLDVRGVGKLGCKQSGNLVVK